MKIKILLCLLLLLPTTLFSKHLTLPKARLERIIDGDTIVVNFPQYPEVFGKSIPVRFRGLDTPELRGKCEQEKKMAQAAKDWLVQRLQNIELLELDNVERGKYFRLVADVIVDGKSLKSELLATSFAVPFDGQTKTHNWCKK